MRIDKYTFPYLFQQYVVSLNYRSGGKALLRKVTRTMLELNEVPNEEYAPRYALLNGIEGKTVEEELALWFDYNLRINDLLYKKLSVEVVSSQFAQAARDNAQSLLNSASESGYYDLFGTCAGRLILSTKFAVEYAIQEDGCFFASYDLIQPSKGDKQLHLFGKQTIELKCSLDKRSEHEQAIFTALAVLLLKKFGKVETVLIGGNVRREIDSTGEVVTNKAPFPITYLDCSWLKTIVRTEGFLVRGHFRLQPYGEGRLERKLIYIEPFQKHGYTRTAKKLIAERGTYSLA